MVLTMFTSAHCVACKAAKKALTEAGIQLIEIYVDDDEGREEAGRQGIKGGLPAFIYKSKIVIGWYGTVGNLLKKF